MNKKLIAVFSFILVNTYAQNNCDEVLQTQIVDKIKPYSSNNLVPYYSKEADLWGFLDKNSKKAVTEPIMQNESFFNPSTRFYFKNSTTDKTCTAELSGSNERYKVSTVENYQVYDSPGLKSVSAIVNFTDKIKNDIDGFEVDSLGNLTYFNAKFYNHKENKPNIHSIKFFKGKYYAVTSFENEGIKTYSVIDQYGNIMENFKNLKHFPQVKFSYEDDQKLWFLIKQDEKSYCFQSLIENKKIENITSYPYYLDYNNNTVGYSIVQQNDKDGLLDLTTMKWKIKPSAKNDFVFLYYASLDDINIVSEKITTKKIQENRKKANIYLRNSGNLIYDLNLKEYSVEK